MSITLLFFQFMDIHNLSETLPTLYSFSLSLYILDRLIREVQYYISAEYFICVFQNTAKDSATLWRSTVKPKMEDNFKILKAFGTSFVDKHDTIYEDLIFLEKGNMTQEEIKAAIKDKVKVWTNQRVGPAEIQQRAQARSS